MNYNKSIVEIKEVQYWNTLLFDNRPTFSQWMCFCIADLQTTLYGNICYLNVLWKMAIQYSRFYIDLCFKIKKICITKLSIN